MTTIHGVTHAAPSMRLPSGCCDCHTHVFGPAARFPYDPGRAYTPGDASIANLQALHRHLGIDRVVIVHPSPYGSDNRVSLDAIAQIGLATARGVAVIDPASAPADLRALDAGGMRGARVNLETAGVIDPTKAWLRLSATADRIAPLGWHLQMFTRLDVIEALETVLLKLPVPVVIDHFGRLEAAGGITQPGFDALRRLVGAGKAYVKLSAQYRVSKDPDGTDIAPMARALIAENPERMLWGTDWPHPGGTKRSAQQLDVVEPFLAIDDGAALNRLLTWAGTYEIRRCILVENPARLYGFG